MSNRQLNRFHPDDIVVDCAECRETVCVAHFTRAGKTKRIPNAVVYVKGRPYCLGCIYTGEQSLSLLGGGNYQATRTFRADRQYQGPPLPNHHNQ